jgi:hypothetical protein
MRVTGSVHELEVDSAQAMVSEGGRFAVIAFVVSGDHFRMSMKRRLFDRLALQIEREQTRVPRPARRLSSDHESSVD